jgi:hypothetical protein
MIPMVQRMPPLHPVWFGVPVAGELSEGKQRDDAAQVKCRELVVVDDLRPAEVAVEAPEAGKSHVRRT